MAISFDKLVGFHHKALNLRNDRMEIVAGNLANANTPGYKAKDLDFKQAMASANYERTHKLTTTDSNHIKAQMQTNEAIMFRSPLQPDTGDGNDVDVQLERNAFLDTGMRYQVGIEFLNGKIKGMKKAISGGQGS